MSPQAPQGNRPNLAHRTPPVDEPAAKLGTPTGHQDSATLDARDALTDLLFVQLDRSAEVYDIAGAVMAAGWRPPARVIEDPAELDALPELSVVLVEGRACSKYLGEWVAVGSDAVWSSRQLIKLSDGPVTVVFTPTETGEANG